jgi:hypothetical protein
VQGEQDSEVQVRDMEGMRSLTSTGRASACVSERSTLARALLGGPREGHCEYITSVITKSRYSCLFSILIQPICCTIAHGKDVEAGSTSDTYR